MLLCAQGHPAMPDESHHPEIAQLPPNHYETKAPFKTGFECTETFEMQVTADSIFLSYKKLF